MNRTTHTAIAALLALPLTVAAPVLAQTSTADQTTGAQQTADDPLIATVGDARINASDVSAAIAAMPEQMQRQPAQQLVPFAVEQLILRQLVLQTAMAETGTADSDQMASDDGMTDETDTTQTADADAMSGEEVTDLAESAVTDDVAREDADLDVAEGATETQTDDGTETASNADGDDATSNRAADNVATDNSGQLPENIATGMGDIAEQMQRENEAIRAYMDDRMTDIVTDENVQAAYNAVKEQATTEIPPLEALRPQIEQELRRQEMASIREELMQNIEVVFYGPDGKPRSVTTGEGTSDEG